MEIFNILFYLFWPIFIFGLSLYFTQLKKRGNHPATNKEWYTQFALSKEDWVSQNFLLLSFFFLGVTLQALNKNLGDLFSWQIILLITSLAGLICAYWLKTSYVLFFSLLVLMSWWIAQATQWIEGQGVTISAIFAGLSFIAILFYVIGRMHDKKINYKRFGFAYSSIGVLSVTIALYLLSTQAGISFFEEMTRGVSFLNSNYLTYSLFTILALLFGATLWATIQKLIFPIEMMMIFALICLFGVTGLLTATDQISISAMRELFTLIYNIAIFLELFGLIYLGYMRGETWLINFGALFLFLLIIAKYFDWFFTFLDKSIFFIGAGILFFVVGWIMERGRRYMISNIS